MLEAILVLFPKSLPLALRCLAPHMTVPELLHVLCALHADGRWGEVAGLDFVETLQAKHYELVGFVLDMISRINIRIAPLLHNVFVEASSNSFIQHSAPV